MEGMTTGQAVRFYTMLKTKGSIIKINKFSVHQYASSFLTMC